MTKNIHQPLIAAAFNRQPERYPVWFMRQAGRYLPEYRDLRAKMSFVDLCKSPKDAAEVTLQPLRRYDVDASIIFSDILIPCMAMGQELSFGSGHGPILKPAIRNQQTLADLCVPQEKDYRFVGEAIQIVAKNLRHDQTMIGFAGAPFTVATYMIEGQGTKTFSEVKGLLFRDPKLFGAIIDLICEVTAAYLKMQVEAGAQTLMLFDTWLGQLTVPDFQQHVWPKTNALLSTMRSYGVPIIYFPGQGSTLLPYLQDCQAHCLSIDWRVPLHTAFEITEKAGLPIALQGNLDPLVLLGDESLVRQRTRDILAAATSWTHKRGHIFNVGHGLTPATQPEALNWVVDEIRKS